MIGYLSGGFEAWKAAGKEYDAIVSRSAKEVAKLNQEGALRIFDVRYI